MLHMVIDVESIGLHGEGFAVGFVVVDQDGLRHGVGMYACAPEMADGPDDGRAWIAENCSPLDANCTSPHEVRYRFWQDWLHWKGRGALMVADCGWPVEARFLAACVDDHSDRTWTGPYPLHELASFMVAAGLDPMASYERLPDEPQHDPLGDARQSARLLVSALAKLRGETREPVAGGGLIHSPNR